jgi:hypothetical protein
VKNGTILVGLLVATLTVAVAAGAEAPESNKPDASRSGAAVSPVVTMLLPDILMKIETDGTIMIQNIGDASVTKPFGVDLTCTVKTATVRNQKCGNPFDASGRWFPMLTLPPGTKQAPLMENPGQQT